MTERLLGLETEYALSAVGSGGAGPSKLEQIERLMALAKRNLVHLPALECGGIFMPCGRLYVDSGLHPEFCTPECPNPWDAVRYVLAGERILTALVAQLPRNPPVGEVVLTKCNVDYSGVATTWGCHESYLHRCDRSALAKHLVGHLVSRLVYTGAGGFNSRSQGLEFTLSPRVGHLTSTVSGSSTSNRGIYHTKNESLSSCGYSRLHLICGESLCSHVAAWLKVAATAVVVAMIEGGLEPGKNVRFRSPLAAMRAFAGDPTCTATARTADRKDLTAIAAQRRYLELAEAHAREAFMPPWTDEVCRQWRRMLDLLAGAPESVATTLDWAIKLALFKDRLRRHDSLQWQDLSTCTRVLGHLHTALARSKYRDKDISLDFLLGAFSPIKAEAQRLTSYIKRRKLQWEQFRSFLDFRHELREIDVRFGQLGPRGIFSALDAAGVLTHQMPGVDNIEHATHNPPASGRARLRGELIRQLAGNNGLYSCNWHRVRDLRGRRQMDLADPFATAADWQDLPAEPDEGESDPIPSRLRRILRAEVANRAMSESPPPQRLSDGDVVLIVARGPGRSRYLGCTATVVRVEQDDQGQVLRLDMDHGTNAWRATQLRRINELPGELLERL